MKKRRVLSFASVAAMLLTMFLSILVAGVSAAPVLPGGATIGEDDEKLVLHPGDVDWVIGTKSTKYTAAEGHFYTDYAQAWAQNSQDGGTHASNTTPEKYVYALNLDVGARTNDYYFGGFMGYPIYDLYRSEAPWIHGGLIYKVQGNSYVAMALALPKLTASTEKAEEFIFESSTDDGITWTKLDTVGDITLEYDANDPVVTEGKNPVVSIYKAVVKLPGADTDTVQLRITIPGGKDDGNGYMFPGLGYGNADHRIGTVVVSAHDLSQYKKLDQVPEFKTPVLSPGIYDELEDDFYYDYHIQGTYNDKATPQTGYNYNNDTDYAATYIVKDKTGATNGESSWGRTTFVGGFMGTVVEKVIGSKAIWRGAGLVYAVEPESYVATAFSIAPDLSITDAINGTSTFKGLQLEVSADKSTWTPVTPEYSAEEDINGEDPYEWNCYKLVVKIPAGMNWYRLTLPGIKADASTTDEMTWVACPFENSCGFGPSIASKYDLADYTDLKDVPDSPTYVDIKAELKDAITASNAVVLSNYKDDAAKDAFVAKLAEAKTYLEEDHTQDEYKAKAAELLAAKEALNKRELPDGATIGQDDPRKILKPGVADWINGSVFTDAAGEAITGTDGNHKWYTCYTDYAKANLLSTQDGVNADYKHRFHATAYDHYLYANFQALEFMGKPLEGVFVNCASWACGVIEYRVYAGSYVATAIVAATNAQSSKNFPDIQEDYVFQVSADGQTWTDVEAKSLDLVDTYGSNNEVELYKAVIQIPEGMSYYRVVMPGATSISPDTQYTPDCPSYDNTYVGPTIASMSDLSEVETYEDIPDATDWYADPAVTSKDQNKIQITEEYFKAREEDMTIADALAALDTATGTYVFYTADGTKITDETTKLVAGMKADLVDSKGYSMNKVLGMPMLTVSTGNDLLSIGTLEDIVLEYGAEKTVEGLKLPATVKIEAGNGSFDAEIEWDVEGCEYDPSVSQEQTFTVTGTVVLPEEVTNGSNISLEIGVNVTVQGSTDYGVRSTDESKVKVDSDEDMIYVKEGMTLEEINEILQPVGDVTIVFASAEGEDLSDLSVKAERGMTVDVYTDVVMIKSYEIAFLGDSGDDESDVSIPETGDSGKMLPAMLLAFVAAASGAAMILAKKRRA